MIVYRIYDKETGKSYIGQTSMSLHKRIYGHLHKSDSAIGEAMRQRGQENFDVSVIDVCETKKDADRAEMFWIKFYDSVNNGYNIHEGGTPDKKRMAELRAMQTKGKRGHTKKFLRKQAKKKEEELYKRRKKKHEERLLEVKVTPLPSIKEIYQNETELLKRIMIQQRLYG